MFGRGGPLKFINTDLRYRDEQGFVHFLREGEKVVRSGRGDRTVQIWTALCGDRVFTASTPPKLIDEPASCLECIGDVPE
jgi:hypothetical protein